MKATYILLSWLGSLFIFIATLELFFNEDNFLNLFLIPIALSYSLHNHLVVKMWGTKEGESA